VIFELNLGQAEATVNYNFLWFGPHANLRFCSMRSSLLTTHIFTIALSSGSVQLAGIEGSSSSSRAGRFQKSSSAIVSSGPMASSSESSSLSSEPLASVSAPTLGALLPCRKIPPRLLFHGDPKRSCHFPTPSHRLH